MKEVALGIDIGGTNTVFGVIDREGNTMAEGSIFTSDYDVVDTYLEVLKKKTDEIFFKIKEKINFKGIGIGAPNGNFYNGTIEFAPNLKWKGVVPLAKMIGDKYNIPAFLTNDANAAAIGEMVYGNAKGMKNFIIITLGTGLGSGIVVNGDLVYGHDGFAGEIGHTIVIPNGRPCGCGRSGCLETYASAPGIIKTVKEFLNGSNPDSLLYSINPDVLTAKDITIAAEKGDKIALKAFEYTGEILGLKLADSVAYTSPEAIFLYGGLSLAGDLILKPTKYYMEKNMLNIYKDKVKLLLSGLNDKNGAVLGAGALVWKELG